MVVKTSHTWPFNFGCLVLKVKIEKIAISQYRSQKFKKIKALFSNF